MFETKEETAVVLGMAAIIIIGVTCGLAQPYFEAKSFNKLTGGNATYWDAMWTELRVDGSSQVQKRNATEKAGPESDG